MSIGLNDEVVENEISLRNISCESVKNTTHGGGIEERRWTVYDTLKKFFVEDTVRSVYIVLHESSTEEAEDDNDKNKEGIKAELPSIGECRFVHIRADNIQPVVRICLCCLWNENKEKPRDNPVPGIECVQIVSIDTDRNHSSALFFFSHEMECSFVVLSFKIFESCSDRLVGCCLQFILLLYISFPFFLLSFFCFFLSNEVFIEVEALLSQLFVVTLCFDHPILHHEDVISTREILKMVGHKKACFVLQLFTDAFLKYVTTNMGIHCREWVI